MAENFCEPRATLSEVCRAHLLNTKWLIAPSHRVGHQWIESLIRSGRPVINLRPTTTVRLALDLVGAELAEEGLTLATRGAGLLIVDAAIGRLAPNGYLGRLTHSADLSAVVYESLLSLRLAGIGANNVDESQLESRLKARDIVVLLKAYEGFLKTHALVDQADMMRRAMARLRKDSHAVDQKALILIPEGLHVTGLERVFLDAFQKAQRIEISHPAHPGMSDSSATDIRMLKYFGQAGKGPEPQHDGAVQFFRSVGEINEIREVLRRCLAEAIPLDDVELLHTDAETYIPLTYATARRYFSEPERPEGVPVTYAEGIPASLSRPGRALAGWLRWIGEGFPQRLLIEMISEGLLNCGEDEDVNFTYLVWLLRPIAIGVGADNYLPKLDEQITALSQISPQLTALEIDNLYEAAAHERKVKGLKTLRRVVAQLLDLSGKIPAALPSSILEAAEKFLTKSARSINELDRYASEALVEQLHQTLVWMERLGVTADLGKWLAALPSQTRVLGSGPRPGHLHVAHVSSGGHSGRKHTFVVGLDDRRFPGAVLQDPILLDRERANLSMELSTSTARLRQKIDDLAATLSRLSGSVVLSWPCHDLAEDREIFPSPLALSAYRLVSGRQEADLEAFNTAVGPPVSFAPMVAEKALDESERWLWRLSGAEMRGTDQSGIVEARFPHLARGSEARRQQSGGFGSFNGCIPQAGKDLDPYQTAGPVLSASALETAGRCPRAFFFRSALKLYPPDELEVNLGRWLDAAQFGLLLHEVFRRFMSGLSSADQLPDFKRDHNQLAEC